MEPIEEFKDFYFNELPDDMFKMMIDVMPAGIILVNPVGRIVYASSRLEEMFGYIKGGLLGEKVELLIPEKFKDIHIHHREEYAKNARIRQMGQGKSLKAKHNNGSEFPVEIGLAAFSRKGVKYYMALVMAIIKNGDA